MTARALAAGPESALFKMLLVPVDVMDAETAMPAIERAAALALHSNGSIRLIYVISVMPANYMEFATPDLLDDQQNAAERELDAIAVKIGLPRERVSRCVRMGSIYHEILSEVEDTGADLVVVGSHRPSMRSYLLGSNAATIVRHATCSVLVVRQ
jgi:nucleotide-binding universal stress UspA family protein